MEALQLESDAPKRDARVSPPVEEALVKFKMFVVRLLEVREDTVVVAKEEVPEILKRTDDRLLDVRLDAVVVAK